MLKGVLIINLEPSYIGFMHSEGPSQFRDCSYDEIKELLVELGGLNTHNSWPLQEFILRLPGEYSHATLRRFGLAQDFAA